MGIIKRGILGGFSKSVANVVGTSWKGIAVMKSKPLSVANPRSAGQVAQRTRFSATVAFAQAILSSVLIPVWNGFASQMSGYNLFIQRNVASLFNANGLFLPENLILNPKAGTPANNYMVEASAGANSVTLEWSSVLSATDQQDTDKAIIVVANANGEVIYSSFYAVARSAGNKDITPLVELTLAETIHVYLSFMSEDGKRTFDTQYEAVIVGA